MNSLGREPRVSMRHNEHSPGATDIFIESIPSVGAPRLTNLLPNGRSLNFRSR
jgi:hypothetical protein